LLFRAQKLAEFFLEKLKKHCLHPAFLAHSISLKSEYDEELGEK
jgi:hypothetical protein